GVLRGFRHGGAYAFEHLGRLELKLPRHVQRTGRDEDVEARAVCVGDGFGRRLEVAGVGAGQRRDRRAGDRLRDRADALEVSGGGAREARLDDGPAETLELGGDLRLLAGLKRDARRLLAVTEGGIEDRD